jgi:uncharacterized protein
MIRLSQIELDETRLASVCRNYSVRELSVFGSATSGNMRPDSDIDMLVEFQPAAEIGLIEFAGLMLDLTELVGRKVDLVSKKGLKPLIRDSVLDQAQLIYAA